MSTDSTVSQKKSLEAQKLQIPWSRGDVLLWIFGPLLFLSLAIYIFLHWPNAYLPHLAQQPYQAKIEVLKKITEARKVAFAVAESPQQRTRLVETVLGGMRENLNAILALHTNTLVLQKAEELEQETARASPDPDKIQLLLAELDQEVRAWNWYFWSTVPWRWVEVLSWGWFGTLVYLLTEIYEHYRLTTPTQGGPPSEAREAYFLVNTPRYFVVASRGTLTVFVILLFIGSVRIGGTGIEITPEQVSIELLVFLALTLGFYNRVAAQQLDLIIAAVFSEAWKRTQRTLEIDPKDPRVLFGQTQVFKTDPDVRVRWSIQPANRGTIDRISGTYMAPAKREDISDEAEQVVVLATRLDDPTVSTVAIITLTNST